MYNVEPVQFFFEKVFFFCFIFIKKNHEILSYTNIYLNCPKTTICLILLKLDSFNDHNNTVYVWLGPVQYVK